MTRQYEYCDVCGKRTEFLVDYYIMLCQDCVHKYWDTGHNKFLLNRISSLCNKIDKLEQELERQKQINILER